MPTTHASTPPFRAAEPLLDQLPLALMVVDTAGLVLRANLEAQNAIGMSEAKLLGQPIAPYLRLETLRDDEWHALLRAPLRLPPTPALLHPRTGKESAIMLEAAPVEHTGQSALAFYFSTQTPYSAATEDASLRHAHMANILAHEIKNPLTGIRGAAQLLKKHVPEAAQKFTQVIIQEVDRIRALVDEMVDFSEESRAEFQPINVHEVLRHCCTLLASNGHAAITIKESFDPSLPELRGQPDKLVQLFLNLLLNAQEALKDTPEAVITLRSFYRHGLRAGAVDAELVEPASIVIQVEDNGPGVAAEIIPEVLEPFISTKPGSRGLGLPVAAKIAHTHKGSLQLLESKAGSTIFEICLPRWK